MSILAEQKSQLAKLMATENLTVQHSKIRTAAFDTKNRVLYLPIWKNMDGAMYDLLSGHEVGHALYTPNEGWHGAAKDQSKGKNYKSFLNVIEDARIEKKIKRKYPGLRNSFAKAYKTLLEQDFFGIKNRDLNSMPFIDRLNIYTKSQYTADWIEFNQQERDFIKQVLNLETWDDVVRLTDAIYEYSKNEQQELDDMHFDFDSSTDDGDDEDQEYDFDDGQDSDGESGEVKSSKNGKKNDEESDDDFDSDSQSTDEDGDDDYDSTSESSIWNRQKESSASFEDQYDPTCVTDNNYREKEALLIDDKCKNYVYIDLPKVNLSEIVTPAKRVQELLTNHYNQSVGSDKSVAIKLVNEFKSKNEKYISLLAKEFEMRKAAKAYSKSKISETGDLDINKLASFKFNDNIFRKVTSIPKGKSHGLVLLLDRSGSMSQNMSGSIEQVLILAMFCRKVNIPFVVYGFGDCVAAREIDYPLEQRNDCFDVAEKTLRLSEVFLREYLNSNMTNTEFSRAIYNMILLKKSYEGGGGRYPRLFGRPASESLSNTPLTQAIVAMAPIMQQFRKVNNLDITNLVIVHDGDADDTNSYWEEMDRYDGKKQFGLKGVSHYYEVPILRDKNNKFEYKLDPESKNRNEVYAGVMKWFKAVTKSKVFGFYITPYSFNAKNIVSNHYRLEDGSYLYEKRNKNFNEYNEKLKGLMKKFKEEKFLSNKSGQFDDFYFVSGGAELEVEEEEIEISGKATSAKLKNAFMKYTKKKSVNRVLVSRFIQGIAVV